jgi:hypothetical protein
LPHLYEENKYVLTYPLPSLGPEFSHTLFSPCPGTSHANARSAGNSKQFTDATTVELCLSLSENAVKTQTWCAIAAYILIAIVEKELQLDVSLYTCPQILAVSIFEKTQISCALHQTTSNPHLQCNANQLIWFDI